MSGRTARPRASRGVVEKTRARAVVALGVALAGLWVGTGPLANAQERGGAVDNPIRRKVELTIEGESDPDLANTIRELVGRLGIEVVRPAARGAGEGHNFTLARVWVDFGSFGEALIVVSDVRTGDVVLRRSIPKNPSVSIFREEIAHAVHSAVESELLVEQDRVDAASRRPAGGPPSASAPPELPPSPSAPAPSPPPAPPPPAPPPSSPPAPPRPEYVSFSEARVLDDKPQAVPSGRSSLALDVTTLVGVGPFASGTYVPRVTGGAILGSRRGLRSSLALTVSYLVPFDASSPYVDARTNVLSARAVPGVELFRGARMSLGVGAGVGFDALNVTPGSTTLPPPLGASTTRLDPILSPVLEGHFGLTAGVVLTVAVACDFDLASRRYVLEEGGADSNVFVPWRVRPTLLAGFTFTALGEGLFAARGTR